MDKVTNMTASETSAHTHWFRRIFLAPKFADEEKTRAAQFLNAILIITAIFAGTRSAIGLLQHQYATLEAALNDLLLGGLAVVSLILLVMVRFGLVRFVSFIFLGLVWVAMVFFASAQEGIHDGAFAALTAAIVMASLLLGWKGSAVVAALSIAAGWVLASRYAGQNQVLDEDSSTAFARDTTIIFTLLVVLMYLVVNSLQQALRRSRVSEQSLQEQNVELTNLHAVLEERVTVRTEQLRASAEVGRVAASILNPDQLLSDIVNLITDRLGYYYAAIFTLDRTGTYLILREATGDAGRVLKERGHRLRVGIDSMVGYTVMRREARVTQSAGQDDVRFANPLLPDTQSEVALPLIAGNEVLGALDVQSRQGNAFDENVIAALQAMASQIATALQNAQSFHQLQQTLDYTTRQYELGRRLFAARNVQEAYQALGDVYSILSNIDRISLMLITDRDINDEATEFELAAEWDVLGGAQLGIGLRYRADAVPLAPLVAPDEMIVISDATDARLPLVTRERLERAEAQAVILCPVMIRDIYAGFTAVVAAQPRDFSDSEIRLLRSMAEQLGVVLTNLQLTSDMQTTLERVALLNRQLSGEAWNQYLGERTDLVIESGHTEAAALTAPLRVPIAIRGEAVGAFTLSDANPDRQWSNDELTLLRTIADEVALAVDNARLIEQTQRNAQREREIAEAADKIHRSANLETILRTAVEEVMRITGTPDVAIQMGHPEAQAGNGQRAPSS
jgi:GAF domain-containing protein